MAPDQSPQDWEKLWETFHKIREADPSARAAYLNNIESSDPGLFHKVKELLSADEKSGQMFEELVAHEFHLLEESDTFPAESEKLLAGRFRILRQLGKGGMGTVYEAMDEELGINVALKMMRTDLALDPAARERFHREINMARQITHPNACRIFDLFRHEDLLFLTMELLAGETLHEKIRRDGPFSPNTAISIVLQVSQALLAIHNSGIIHRDFKSSNILLVPHAEGLRAVVTDFGLATTLPGKGSLHVTETGQVFGTPEFMAPEQLKRESLTRATDVYALGLVLYEMLTGKLPLEGESPLTIAARRISEEAPTPRKLIPDLDRKWERVILRCLERNPRHRFQDASEVAAALQGESLTNRIPVLPRRHRARLLSGLLILLIGIFAGLHFWIQGTGSSTRSDMVVKRLWTGATGLPAGVLSTNGKTLIDIDWQTADVMAIDLSTGKKRPLSNSGVYFMPREYVSYPLTTALSNQGKHVAYSVQYATGRWDLKIVKIDGSQTRTIYSSKESVVEPNTWSPDDNHILALMKHNNETSQICLFSAQDGSIRVLKTLDSLNVRKMSFSPDSRYIVYDYQAKDSTNYDVFVLSMKSGEETQLVSHPANDYVLGWVAGADQIVFASDRSGSHDAWLVHVVDGKPQGAPELTRKDIGQIYPLKLTAEGSLYYAHLLTSADIYLASPKEKTAVKLSHGVPGSNRFAQFSPDGESLLFQTVINPVATRWAYTPVTVLRIVSMETNQETSLSDKIKFAGGLPRWSHEGRSILTDLSVGSEGAGLYKINMESGESTRVIAHSGTDWISQFYWSADDSAVFYLLDNRRTIWLRDLASKTDKQIYEGATNFTVSRDGLWLAVTSMNIKTGKTDLLILPATGGKARKILTLNMPEFIPDLTWTPDGREILFARGRRDLIDQPHKLWSISIHGGKPKDVGISTEYVHSLSFAPDGRRIAISTSTDTSEVWVMENFLRQSISPR
jgi:Tol biopolymer transport system component